MCNQKAVENLQALLNIYVERTNPPLEVKDVNTLYKYKKRTNREMQLTAQIGDYEMEKVILDLGSDGNVLPKKTWQCMGEPNLEWSNIQLCIAN